MAFKEVVDLDCDTTISLGGRDKTGKNNPTSIEGYYIGAKEVASKLSKTGFAKLHVFKTAKGTVGVWGKTDLDRKLVAATAGAMTRVSFTGTVPTERGKDMFKYKVLVDAEQTIEIPSALAASGGQEEEDAAGTYAADGYDEGGEEESLDAEEPSYDEVPPARPTPTSRLSQADVAAKKAKVEKLLGNRKNVA